MNKMNKKRVVPVLLGLALVSSVAVFANAAPAQSLTAGKFVASSPTSFSTSSDVNGTTSSLSADAALPAADFGANSVALNSAPSVPVTKNAAVSELSFSGGSNGQVKAIVVKSSSSCPSSLNSAASANPSYSAAVSSALPQNNGTCPVSKVGGRIVISGGSVILNGTKIPNGTKVPCNQYICGTQICSIIKCEPSSCKSTSCTSSSCKSSKSGTPSSSAGTSSGKTPSSGSASAPTAPQSSYAQQVLQIVNSERAKNGLKALTLNTSVAKAAQLRANEISTQFSHTRPNGQDPFTALNQFGVSYSAAGENIAYGQRTPQEVMNGWMNSPGHRANILNSRFTQIGIGVYQVSGVYYWTQEFIG